MNSTNSTNYELFNLINSIKIGLFFGLFIMVLCATLVPYELLRYYLIKNNNKYNQNERSKMILSFFNCLSAGVFMTTGLLEIFPEVIEKTEKALNLFNVHIHFHLAAFVVICGIFFIMFIEEILHSFQDRLIKSEIKLQNDFNSNETLIQTEQTEISDIKTYNTFKEDGASKYKEESVKETIKMTINTESMFIFILIVALAVHSLFEGLALGLQTTVKDTLLLFLALSLHKCVIAITIGLEMAQLILSKWKVILGCFIFAISSPIGLIIGTILDNLQNVGDNRNFLLSSAILEGLACGTFLFIVFFEILPRELSLNGTRRLSRFIGMMLGFALVSLLMFFTH